MPSRRDCFRQALAIGILFSTVATRTEAQEPNASKKSVPKLIAEFQAEWNDDAWEPADGRLSRYMRPMDDSGWKSRFRTFHDIVKYGQSGTPALIEALASESASVRALASQALGYCGTDTAIATLARVVENENDAMVRLYAADSLGMLGGTEHHELLRRLEPAEQNRDTKRHFDYALDRNSERRNEGLVARLQDWDIKKLDSAQLGQPAPDFELGSLNGQRIRLSQFRGKKAVVLVFIYGDT